MPGSFSQVNDVACKRLGYTREELLALSPRDITTPEAYETISAARERLVSTGEVIIETVHVTKDGNKIPTESSVRLFNYLGRQAAISIARDITERKRAEEAIVWMAQEWKRTFDSMSEAIWILDKDFWVLRSNKTAEHIFNRPCAEMVGKHCWEIVHGTTQPIPECPIIRAKKSLYHESQELQIGGSCFEINVDPFLNKDGQLVGAVHVVRDITERKRAEAEKEKLRAQLFQSQKMETVGHLAGGIAHDFNNILAAIMGYANLLQTKMSAADPLYSHVEHILSSSERAATLVHSLLAFSRKQTLSVKQVKINDLVSGVAKLLVRLLGEDITLETVFTGRDPLIMADAGQIDQILFNLATNARDAMPGGGHLTITTDITEIDDTYITEHGYGVLGDYALLTVSDTGAGMDKALQGKIFEPFFTTKEVGKGTGLGLSTAYGIVKQHNGFINCYSEPGTGTTFKIYLPLLEPDTKAENEKTGKRNELMPEGTETILVAEDDAAVKELIINILSQYGYTVYEAEDGAQAVQVFTEHAQEIDLLVFDIIMPR
ncbi:MAG: PAS domain S-box protein, partial [Proteobacteria bacterium]|nr:PAS domain S-box protein [Pseudomonadota bacterium]